MRTIERAGIVRIALLSLGLLAGCASEPGTLTQHTDPQVAGVEEVMPVPKTESDENLTLDLGNGVTIKLVRIEPGTFAMGSARPAEQLAKRFDAGADVKDEYPRHKVTITTPLYMGATEVTQAQWTAVMNTQPWEGLSFATDGADNAANWISWNDATAFCAVLSAKTGRTVRLPTEAEWEYACRAGTTTTYSFGDDASTLDTYAWHEGNAWRTGEKYAHPVDIKQPNPWGLYGMHGNVHEWCADWYANSYANADASDPKGPSTGMARVLRGGSWYQDPDCCRAASRSCSSPELPGYCRGFRMVVVANSVQN